MDIKGVSDLNKDFKTKSSEENVPSKKTGKAGKSVLAEKVELSNTAVNSRIRNSIQEMKEIQNQTSKNQSYLASLNKTAERLANKKNNSQLYKEMADIRKNATFNNKPLMNAVIPDHKSFFDNYDVYKNLLISVMS